MNHSGSTTIENEYSVLGVENILSEVVVTIHEAKKFIDLKLSSSKTKELEYLELGLEDIPSDEVEATLDIKQIIDLTYSGSTTTENEYLVLGLQKVGNVVRSLSGNFATRREILKIWS